MMNNLKNLLIDETKPATEEMSRLARIRGLQQGDVKGMDIDAFLAKYFAKDNSGQPLNIERHNYWAQWQKCFGAKNGLTRYVSPKDLDPFVARYVVAINQAGVQTCSSCDGWHTDPRKELFIECMDRYSQIWHKIILSFLKDQHGIRWNTIGLVLSLPLPKSDEGRVEKYLALNKNAEELEKLAPQFRELKKRMVNQMKGERKNPLSDEAIERRMKAVVEDLLKEHPIQ